MCLGARRLHPRLDLRVGKQGSGGSEKGAMLPLRNALSYGVRGPTTLVRNADLA